MSDLKSESSDTATNKDENVLMQSVQKVVLYEIDSDSIFPPLSIQSTNINQEEVGTAESDKIVTENVLQSHSFNVEDTRTETPEETKTTKISEELKSDSSLNSPRSLENTENPPLKNENEILENFHNPAAANLLSSLVVLATKENKLSIEPDCDIQENVSVQREIKSEVSEKLMVVEVSFEKTPVCEAELESTAVVKLDNEAKAHPSDKDEDIRNISFENAYFVDDKTESITQPSELDLTSKADNDNTLLHSERSEDTGNKDYSENILVDENARDSEDTVREPDLRSSPTLNKIEYVEIAQKSVQNKEIEKNDLENVAVLNDETVLTNDDAEDIFPANDEKSAVPISVKIKETNYQVNLESTLIEGNRTENIPHNRFSFSENSVSSFEMESVKCIHNEDNLIEKAKTRRSVKIESFSPILKTNDTSLDTSSNSTKMEEISDKGDCNNIQQSKSHLKDYPYEEADEFDVSKESDETSSKVLMSSCAVKPSYSSPLFSPIDASPDVSVVEECKAANKTVFYSPHSNPLNQTFKQLPEPEDNSFTGEDNFNLSEDKLNACTYKEHLCLERSDGSSKTKLSSTLGSEVLKERNKSPDSVYHDCVPGNVMEPDSSTVSEIKQTERIDVEDVSKYTKNSDGINCEINISDEPEELSKAGHIEILEEEKEKQLEKPLDTSFDDSGTEIDVSPSLASTAMNCRVVLKDISSLAESYTKRNTVADYVRRRSSSETSISNSQDFNNSLVKEKDPSQLSPVLTLISKYESQSVESNLDFNCCRNLGSDEKKIQYFQERTGRVLEDEQLNNFTTEQCSNDIVSSNKEVVTPEITESRPLEMSARPQPKDLKDRKIRSNISTVKESKTLITKKPNAALIQGKTLDTKQTRKTSDKTSVEVEKRSMTAGAKLTKDVRPITKAAAHSSQIIPKKETNKAASTTSIPKKESGKIGPTKTVNPKIESRTAVSSKSVITKKQPTPSARIAPAAKTNPRVKSSSTIATASSRDTTSTATSKKPVSVAYSKPSGSSSGASSAGTKPVTAAQPTSRYARTEAQPSKSLQKSGDPLKTFMAIAKKTSPLPSPTAQRKVISTTQGVRSTVTQSALKPSATGPAKNTTAKSAVAVQKAKSTSEK